MATADRVYLSALAHQLGERRPISELSLPDDMRRQLLGSEGGLAFHLVSQESCIELAVGSARKTLAFASERGLRGKDIDALVLASNSLALSSSMQVIASITQKLELSHASVCVMSAGDCCNFQVAARLCHGLVSSGQHRNVLFIAVDRVADVCPGQFIAVRGAGINSDASASCVFSKDMRAGFTLDGRFQHAIDADLLSGQSAAKDEFLKIIGRIRDVAKGLYELCGVTPGQIGQLITNTHTNAVAEMFSLATRIPLARIYTRNIPLTGHCFAADNLINLHDYAADAGPEVGTRIMLMGSGVYQWSTFLVEVADREGGLLA